MPAANETHADLIAQLTQVGQWCWQRGWTVAGSCSYSAVLNRQPLRLLITATASCRSALVASDFSILDDDSLAKATDSDEIDSASSSQADAIVHGWIAKNRNCEAKPAHAVLQTQSVWSGLLADRFNTLDGVLLEDHQLLSRLPRPSAESASTAHAVWLPIVPRGKDAAEQIALIEKALQFHPTDCLPPTALVIQHHSMFTWATDIATARQQVEIFEYFCEYLVRKAAMS